MAEAIFSNNWWASLTLPSLPDKSEAQAEEELLCRLVAMNNDRAAEEARGHIRWLRPEYQNLNVAVATRQSEAELYDTTDPFSDSIF